MDPVLPEGGWRQQLLRPTTRVNSGATLIEIMVAAGLFLFVVTATYAVYDLAQRSNRKTDLHSETYRQAAVALRHIRRELKGATVVNYPREADGTPVVEEQAKLDYQIPQWQGGRIVVDHRGLPVLLPARSLYVADQQLMRSDDEGGRKLAELGDGEIRFQLDESEQLLRVTVKVAKDSEFVSDRSHSERELTMTVGLANKAFWRDLTVLTKS